MICVFITSSVEPCSPGWPGPRAHCSTTLPSSDGSVCRWGAHGHYLHRMRGGSWFHAVTKCHACLRVSVYGSLYICGAERAIGSTAAASVLRSWGKKKTCVCLEVRGGCATAEDPLLRQCISLSGSHYTRQNSVRQRGDPPPLEM